MIISSIISPRFTLKKNIFKMFDIFKSLSYKEIIICIFAQLE
jgi:hypothetical protein